MNRDKYLSLCFSVDLVKIFDQAENDNGVGVSSVFTYQILAVYLFEKITSYGIL